jgi:hypothetical protein
MLDKQQVEVIFKKGIDRAGDEFAVIPTKLKALQNMEFGADRDTIQVRDGWRNLIPDDFFTPTAYSGDDPETFRRLVQRGAETALESAMGFHTADVTGGKWKQIATTLNRAAIEISGVNHPIVDVLESDMAGVIDGLHCVVWTDMSSGGGFVPLAYVQVRRGDQVLMQQALTSVESCCPRVVYSSADQKFFIYWIENIAGVGTIRMCTIANATPTTVSATNTVEATYMLASTSGATTGIPMIGYMDVVLNTVTTGRSIFIAHRSVTGGSVDGVRGLKVSIADGFTISASSSNTLAQIGGACIGVAAVVGGTAGVGVYAYYAQTAVTIAASSAALDSGAAFAVPSTTGRTPTGRITAMLDPNDAFNTRTLVLWDEGTAGSPTSQIVGASSSSAGGTLTGAPTTAVRSVGLASGMFVQSDRVYVGANLFSTVQPTFYAISVFDIAEWDAVTPTNNMILTKHDICARVSCLSAPIANRYQRRGVPRALANSTQARVPIFRSGQDVVSIATTVPVNNIADTNRTPIGLDLLKVEFDGQVNHVNVGQSIVMAGGDPQFFDGQTLCELGFEYYPETPTAAAGGVGTLAAGTYGVTCVYEWTDRHGIVHQSAPAVPVSVVVALNQRITVTVPTLRLTKKDNVRIVVYRTEADGSLYYRMQQDVTYSNSVLNVTSADTVALASESLATATLLVGELLPTTGGVVTAEAFPACKHIALHQDRLVMSGLVDRDLIQYSEENLGVFFPQTNASVYIVKAPAEFGRVSATESMDDKLVVLQERQIGAMFGRGPNRLGQLNEFSPVTKVVGGAGHSWAASSVSVLDADGLWFFDTGRGLRHLNRGFQISADPETELPLGSEVDDLSSSPKSSCVVTTKKQVRFLSAARILVWDYENKQWSVFNTNTYGGGISGVAADGEFRFIASSGLGERVLRENSGYTSDGDSGGTAITWIAQGSWLKLNTLAGFQRLYSIQILGKFKTDSGGPVEVAGETLQVGTRSNYEVGLDQDAPGVFSTFTDWSIFTTNWQIENQPSVQKCESVQIYLTGLSYSGIRITGISLTVGVKRGKFKTARSQRF